MRAGGQDVGRRPIQGLGERRAPLRTARPRPTSENSLFHEVPTRKAVQVLQAAPPLSLHLCDPCHFQHVERRVSKPDVWLCRESNRARVSLVSWPRPLSGAYVFLCPLGCMSLPNPAVRLSRHPPTSFWPPGDISGRGDSGRRPWPFGCNHLPRTRKTSVSLAALRSRGPSPFRI